MEAMNEQQIQNEQIRNNGDVNVKASSIIKLFSSPENRHAFAIENSKISLLI